MLEGFADGLRGIVRRLVVLIRMVLQDAQASESSGPRCRPGWWSDRAEIVVWPIGVVAGGDHLRTDPPTSGAAAFSLPSFAARERPARPAVRSCWRTGIANHISGVFARRLTVVTGSSRRCGHLLQDAGNCDAMTRQRPIGYVMTISRYRELRCSSDGAACTPGAYLGILKLTRVPAPGAVSTTRPYSSPKT